MVFFLKHEEDMYERSEKGSTAPASRNLSLQSMYEQITLTTTKRKLEMLCESSHIVESLHNKILEIKKMVKEMDSTKRTSGHRFFSTVMPHTESKLLRRTTIITI